MAAVSSTLARTRLAGRILLAAIAISVAAVLLLSDRPVGLTDMVRIEELTVLPDTPRLEPVRRYTEIGSGLIPYFPGETAAVPPGAPQLGLSRNQCAGHALLRHLRIRPGYLHPA